MAIEARYESRCSVCDEQIEEGDLIVEDADGDWVHERCADA